MSQAYSDPKRPSDPQSAFYDPTDDGTPDPLLLPVPSPGPWAVEVHCPCAVDCGHPSGNHGLILADAEGRGARIYCVACQRDDLLAALQLAGDFFDGPKPPASIFSPGTRESVRAAIRAAIAKATGKDIGQ